jgi:hypothetical protein
MGEPNTALQWLSLLLCICEVSSLILGTEDFTEDFQGFPQFLQANAEIVTTGWGKS